MEPDFLFEVCFEACNKVGGIYTVVSSKAHIMTEKFPGYVIIGPYFKGKSEEEFSEEEAPEEFKTIFPELEKEGIACHYGTWEIDGKPKTILIDTSNFAYVLDDLKIKYWEHFKIDSLDSGWDFFEPMLWSTAAGKLIERFQQTNQDKKVLAQFHEWIASFGLLLLKMAKSPACTVFTTHATMLGRSISGTGENLYAMLNDMDPEEEARKHGVMNKFSTERACAKEADAFTTVSEITGMEAEKILGRKPDVLTLNGLDMRSFPTGDQLISIQKESRKKLEQFVTWYLKPYYDIHPEDMTFFFTSGRYEFHNKGLDLFVKSLGDLNRKLKEEQKDAKAMAFFFVPNGWTRFNEKLKEQKDAFEKGNMDSIKRDELPTLSTHDLENQDDPLLKSLLSEGLNNDESNPVKAVIIPIYLDEDDGVLSMPYYHATAGCDLGIFASYYEPWGYTPPECLAMGVPTVTSDLAGFGRFISSQEEALVLKRHLSDDSKAQHVLTAFLNDHLGAEKRPHECQELAKRSQWQEFIRFYEEAYHKALDEQ